MMIINNHIINIISLTSASLLEVFNFNFLQNGKITWNPDPLMSPMVSEKIVLNWFWIDFYGSFFMEHFQLFQVNQLLIWQIQ